jgi:hypothetical protein
MQLFNSYSAKKAIFCDATEFCFYDDPNSRIYCHDINSVCGFCGNLIVTNGLVLCDASDSWNCNLCGNDLPFWIPYQQGDTIDFQFHQPYNMSEINCDHGWYPENLLSPANDTALASFEILTCCDDEPLTITEEMFDVIAPFKYIGEHITYDYSGNQTITPIQMIRFNLNAIRLYLEQEGLENCFYFKFNFTANNSCLPSSNKIQFFYSEPFKFVDCSEKNASQVIESEYPKDDCFKMYYGTDFTVGYGTPFQYSNRIRVPGYFEQTNFSVTKEIINTSLKTIMSQKSEVWQLRTHHLPESFVRNLVSILSGKNVYVNGTEYQVQGDINKNNENGSQWYLEVNFEKIDCNKSLSCR